MSSSHNDPNETSMTIQEVQEQRRRRQERMARWSSSSVSSTTPTEETAVPPRRSMTTTTTTTSPHRSLDHEDEIERIREMRARRQLKERQQQQQQQQMTTFPLEGGVPRRASSSNHPLPVASSSSVTGSSRVRASSTTVSRPEGSHDEAAAAITPSWDRTPTLPPSSPQRRPRPPPPPSLSSSLLSSSRDPPAPRASSTPSSLMMMTRRGEERHDLGGDRIAARIMMTTMGPPTTTTTGSHHSTASSSNASSSSAITTSTIPASRYAQEASMTGTMTTMTTMSSRLLERREARASERRQRTGGETATTTTATTPTTTASSSSSTTTAATTSRLAEVERRLARRKSGDKKLFRSHSGTTAATTGGSTTTTTTPLLSPPMVVTRDALISSSSSSSSLSSPLAAASTAAEQPSRYTTEVERRLARRRSSSTKEMGSGGGGGGNNSVDPPPTGGRTLPQSTLPTTTTTNIPLRRISREELVVVTPTTTTATVISPPPPPPTLSAAGSTINHNNIKELILEPPNAAAMIASSSGGSGSSSGNGSDYSLKVRILSAVDMPPHMASPAGSTTTRTQNLPLCPVIKVGFVRIPHQPPPNGGNLTTPVEAATEWVLNHAIEGRGGGSSASSTGDSGSTTTTTTSRSRSRSTCSIIEHIPHSRTRVTTCKLMGKRDNGAVDFHQELRWDQIPFLPIHHQECAGSYQVGIVIEVAARAVRSPANLDESPLPIHVQTASSRPWPTLPPLSPEPTRRISAAVAVAAANSPTPVIHSTSRTEEKEEEKHNEYFVPLEEDNGKVRSLERTFSISSSASMSEEDGAAGGLRSLWRKATSRKTMELEAAEAAAAIARMLVEQESPVQEHNSIRSFGSLSPAPGTEVKATGGRQIRFNVALRERNRVDDRNENKGQPRLPRTDDVRLGCVVIPLSQLPLDKVLKNHSESATLEKWFQVVAAAMDHEDDTTHSRCSLEKLPKIRLELTFSQTDAMDEAEDKVEILEDSITTDSALHSSFGRISLRDDTGGMGEEAGNVSRPSEKQDALNPMLQAGVVDFVAIVGCKDFGTLQNADDGAKGWMEASPECTILEQFPPSNEFHVKNGRKALLPEMVQWFCFPEGSRAWRGAGPPSHSDMKLKRFSASAPPHLSSSVAAFDACLNCTTSFAWFVIASNSDEYGSKLVKTYGAVLRFYVPAPTILDLNQEEERPTKDTKKRIWIPMAICFTSNLPIVGIMEAMILRLCEDLSLKMGHEQAAPELKRTHEALWDLIVKFQKPIPGTVNCSIPFLAGERFLLSLPPRNGLPPIPHGKAVVSTCRLLGPDGLNFILAAALTECKILIHSNAIADIAMVAEVITCLLYPFTWSLPYIPILPLGMLEFVEAPLSYMLGIPTQNLRLIDPLALDDVVVIDLNSSMSPSTSSLARRNATKAVANKNTPPLPAQVANNISQAVNKMLRTEDELDMEFGMKDMTCRALPGLETESLAEREFRVSVAIEVCSLLRGYQECTGTVFNRDKFLKMAPALYEEKHDRRGHGPQTPNSGKVVSARSKRFMSLVVNTQNFHQFLESLEDEIDGSSFFHEIMETFDDPSVETHTASREKIVANLVASLQKVEDQVPTYRLIGRDGDENDTDLIFDDSVLDILDDDFIFDSAEHHFSSSFTNHLFLPADLVDDENIADTLRILETTPWKYNAFLDIENMDTSINEQVNLRQALGDRRYRAWRIEQDEKGSDGLELAFAQTHIDASKGGSALDLTTLVSSMSNDDALESLLPASGTSSLRQTASDPRQQKVTDAKDRDIIRRCLDRANQKNACDNPFIEHGRDLLSEAEKALRNPSAQRFLLSVLAQRTRLEGQRVRGSRRVSNANISTSRLDPVAFDCLVRMSCAILDSCMDYMEYETAYRLLTLTAGFTIIEDDSSAGDNGGMQFIVMTSRIAIHPVFANLAVWKTVMNLHLIDRRNEKKADVRPSDSVSISSQDSVEEEEDETEYEAAVATLFEMQGYNVPGEELSRFATRVSEEKGWFNADDRGRQLLVLARRITVRRDQADIGRSSGESGLEIISRSKNPHESLGVGELPEARKRIVDEKSWTEIAWCHPAAQASYVVSSHYSDAKSDHEYMKRSPVTALASFGQSVTVSAGLDGGVFLAYLINAGKRGVQGIHLDWGSASRSGASSSLDGEYGVGAVSCIATVLGGGGQQSLDHTPFISRDTEEQHDVDLRYQEKLTKYIDGCRVVAGTTAGDLRVWSVKDILSSLFAARNGDEGDATTKSASTRLKFSLRGRALAGHRGGVTAIDAPSQVYRPDSIVTGGADGLLKLWSLRSPVATGIRSSGAGQQQQSGDTTDAQRGRGGDAMSILTGHSGRVACVKTAWHGDRLISGGADRTLRVWDLAAGGKCLNALVGHTGWVTSLREWGSNTIVSGSTDRTLALYDARVSKVPLFTLRYHDAPITDILVGSRTDPIIISASADGSMATWDFRSLSSSQTSDTNGPSSSSGMMVIREPKVPMSHNDTSPTFSSQPGQVFLCRSALNPESSFMSLGDHDGVVREWDVNSGRMESEHHTGFRDMISGFLPCKTATIHHSDNRSSGYVMSSLDGTVRMRCLVPSLNNVI